jgi:hypothetical protein
MEENAKLKQKEKAEVAEEGRRMKQKQEEDAKKIETIREKKVQKMAYTGADTKF